jgi:ATP-binding cassette subfamily B protein
VSYRPGLGGAASSIDRARDPRSALTRLYSYLAPYRRDLAGVAILVVLSAVLELSGPYLLGVAIDRFIGRGDTSGLLRISVLMLATYGAAWLTQFGQNYSMAGISQRVLAALRSELFDHLQTLSLSFFDQRQPGELMSRLTNDIDAINQVLAQSIVDLAGSLLSVVGIAVAMLALNSWLGIGALTILPVMLLFTQGVARRTRSGFRDVQTNLGSLNAVMEENISGARVVQAYGRQASVIADFQRANVAARDSGIRAQSLAMLLHPLLMILSNMDIAIIAALGGWLALRGSVTVGIVASFTVYARRFFRPLSSLAELYNAVQAALAGAERVFETLDEVPQVQDRPGAVELPHIEGRVEFDHVSFSYTEGVPVLQDVNFVAEPGQTIALVGPTGAGKTTIVNLLTRFYDVAEGVIRIDGRDIRDVTQDSVRLQLGIVLQDTMLFSASVLENIRYGRLDATDEECYAAARLANADQFITRLPQGYQTELSERASNLSQGQRQLLAIARAALADPRILILDEATSSVDTRTEALIQEALLKLMKGCTSFVIAHRLSTIRNASLLLVINEGRIIERGTHESLLAQDGFYHRLYISQFRRTRQPIAAAEQGPLEPSAVGLSQAADAATKEGAGPPQ